VTQWHYPKGSTAAEGWDTVIGRSTPGWAHTGLRIGTLTPEGRLTLPAADVERIVLPLAGHAAVTLADGTEFTLAGRPDVFAGPTDMAYLGPLTPATLTGAGRVAVAEAHATAPRPARRLPAGAVPVELRGSGNCSREVRNFAVPVPGALEAESIIACEVLTPGGNWSSYPPHKHDAELAGVETELEEIYYFELRAEPGPVVPERCQPLGYQRVSASDARDIDVLAEVRDGDAVLVPFGWHGPSMAAPGYDMYYLNVMAGPGRERAWRITDHPDQAWIRATWAGAATDPRLPFAAR
jgi:5-deoxy-glucuronate isomerase